MSEPGGRQLLTQGWLQTGVILLGLVATVVAVFDKVDAKADDGLKTAMRAEIKATDVEKHTQQLELNDAVLREELTRIRTILDERLPKPR